MIEIVYKDETQHAKDKSVENLPKNIRQIGEPDGRLRVYVEDFAATYLQKTENYRPEQVKICALFGEQKENNGQPVLFVQSAARLEVQDMPKENGIKEPEWKVAEGIREKFFPEQDVLGWAVICSSQETLLLEQIKTIHRHHFTAQHQILFWRDGGEKEEILFNAGAGELTQLNGYYIYYEENRTMQEYMISHNPTDIDRVGESEDKVVKEFRQAVNKKRSGYAKTAGQLVRVAAAACVVFAIAGVLRYVQKPGVQKTAATIVREQWQQNSETVQDTSAVETTAQAASGLQTSAVDLTEPETKETSASSGDDQVQASVDTVNPSAPADQVQNENTTAEQKLSQIPLENTDTSSAAAMNALPDTTAKENTEDAASTKTQETAAAGYRAYQVRSGDTISSISQAYYGNMSMVKEICSLNHIEEQDLIYTGQILLLP